MSLHKTIRHQVEFSTAFYAQTNRESKRNIQILEDILRACVLDSKGSWDKHLLLVEFLDTNSYQSFIRMTLYEAIEK